MRRRARDVRHTARTQPHQLIGNRTFPKFALPTDGLLARSAPSAPVDVRVSPDGGVVFADQDLDLIRKARFKFAVDSMYGSGRGVLTNIFSEQGDQLNLRWEARDPVKLDLAHLG